MLIRPAIFHCEGCAQPRLLHGEPLLTLEPGEAWFRGVRDAAMRTMTPVRYERRFLRASLALLIAAAACDGREPAEQRVEEPVFATIEAEPFLRLPAATDDDQRFVRISGVFRLQDGTVVVADASQQLRWFNSAGALRRSVELRPQGSNVDRALTWMSGYRGDSLIAYDAASGQLSVFDDEGILARRFRFATDAPLGLILPASPFSDGSLLAVGGPSRVQQWRDGWWAVLQLVTYTAEGDPADQLGTALRHPCRSAVERCAAEFSPYSGTWTAGPGGAYIARPDRTELRFVSGDSAAVLNGPDGWESRAGEGLPTYSRLLLDSEEHLWAQSGDLSRAAVFDRTGELKGTVQVPLHLEIHQVGPDFVTGVSRDAAGTEHVQIHRLHRSSGPQGDGS